MVIGISGKAGSGKDTVGKIIQILLNSPQLNNEGVLTFLRKDIVHTDHTYYPYNWSIKKFADKLKDIVCLLIGCTRTQLEDETFKNTPLGEEWNCYLDGFTNKLYLDKEDAIYEAVTEWDADERFLEHRIMTPRLLMQLIGTECGREIIHPQIWVNSTFADYKPIGCNCNGPGFCEQPNNCDKLNIYPNWIITDMRFPNELTAVQKHGFGIRVERQLVLRGKQEGIFEYSFPNDNHPSETALDDTHFTYTIGNNGTLDDLINQVRQILAMENLLNGYKITNGN